MTAFSRLRLFLIGLVLVGLVACDNAEERAQGHYQRGMTLLEAGEDRKALLEFRNALQLNQDALEPRLEYARLLEKLGERGVIRNYLKVIEINPEHLEARIAVARIQLALGDDGASEHLKVAARVAPDNIEVRALQAVFTHRQGGLEEAAVIAKSVLEEDPGNVLAVGVLIEQLNDLQDYKGAIALLDTALVANPEVLGLHISKLKALEGLNDQTAIGEQLGVMSATFPQNADILRGQVQWFLNQGKTAEAIALQRDVAAKFSDNPDFALQTVALLRQFEGVDAARAEMTRLSGGELHTVAFGRAHADFDFQHGDVPGAIARLEELVKLEMPEAQNLAIQVQTAYFYRANGNPERAQEITKSVLAKDPNQVEALKLSASYAIDNDKPHEAITDLRVALGKKAQDSSILMLLALAHERNGSLGLAQERLALAVQASGVGEKESLAYAEFLARQNKGDIAIGVMDDVLDKRGENPRLLAGLGQVQLSMSDWNGATKTVDRLMALPDSPVAQQLARDLEIAILKGQRKFDETIGILREMWDVAGERSSAMENLVSSYVRTGRTEDAAKFLDEILADDRTNIRANLLRGAVFAFEGQLDQAEDKYRQVIAEHPTASHGYGALANLLMSQSRLEEADEVTMLGIEKADNIERLLFSRAGRLERQGDFEGAIAIYEQLYAANKVSDVLANNLASLLSEFRQDPESLERAYNISKRLRASDQPAFQDTYGWVLYQRGEYEQALPPLKGAADNLPNNIFVQYHLGMVYEKLGKKELAITQLERALELGDGADLPQLENARNVLASLRGE